MVRDGYLLTAASSIPIEGRNTNPTVNTISSLPLQQPIPFDLLHPLTLPSAVETTESVRGRVAEQDSIATHPISNQIPSRG